MDDKMFENNDMTEQPIHYSDIFNQRADSYHYAMKTWPFARQQEFSALLDMTSFDNHQLVLDYPAGGGYLGGHVPHDTNLIHLESSEEFSLYCKKIAAFLRNYVNQVV